MTRATGCPWGFMSVTLRPERSGVDVVELDVVHPHVGRRVDDGREAFGRDFVWQRDGKHRGHMAVDVPQCQGAESVFTTSQAWPSGRVLKLAKGRSTRSSARRGPDPSTRRPCCGRGRTGGRRARVPIHGHRLHGCGAGPRRRPRGPAWHGRHRRSIARPRLRGTTPWPRAGAGWTRGSTATWRRGTCCSHGADWSPSSTSAPAVWVTHPVTSRSPGHSSTAPAARAFANSSTSMPQPGREVADGRCGSRCVSSATPSTTVTRPRQPSLAGSSTDSSRTSASRLERGQRATLPLTGLAVLLSRMETRCEWWAGDG